MKVIAQTFSTEDDSKVVIMLMPAGTGSDAVQNIESVSSTEKWNHQVNATLSSAGDSEIDEK